MPRPCRALCDRKRVGAIPLLAQLGQRIAQRLARHAKDAVEWPIQIHDNVDRGRDRQWSEGDREIGQEITWSAQPKAGENHRQPEH
jgi:hypothetical protein